MKGKTNIPLAVMIEPDISNVLPKDNKFLRSIRFTSYIENTMIFQFHIIFKGPTRPVVLKHVTYTFYKGLIHGPVPLKV